MRARDWAGVDFYRVLGVTPTATREEITAAYRAQARVLHPDTGPTDPEAEAQFVRLTAAYRVLSGPEREAYDRARRRGHLRAGAPAPVVADGAGRVAVRPASRPWQLSRRGGRIALWAGLALVVSGLIAAAVVIWLQVRDARLRREGIPVRAVVVRERGEPRLEFVTRSGAVVRTDLPDAKSGGVSAGDVIDVRYDREDPSRVVTERHTLTRDITLWIVAAKLLVVGAVLAVVGARRLLKPDGPDPGR